MRLIACELVLAVFAFPCWGETIIVDQNGSAFPICSAAANQYSPTIYGNIVVWEDERNGNADIYAYNLVTNEEFVICTGGDNKRYPAIHGNIVVWMDYRNASNNIYGYDLVTKREFPIYTGCGSPAIYGNTVVWMDYRNGNYDIYGYDLVTKQEFPICTEVGNKASPAIYCNIVVWMDGRNDSGDIYGFDLITEEEFVICTAVGQQYHPAIHGNIVVWEDSRSGGCDIYGYDLVTKQEFLICDKGRHPAIYDNTVAWMDYRDGNGADYYDIYGYNLVTKQEFVICTAAGNQQYPAIYDNTVVWQDDRNGDNDIYAAYIIQLGATLPKYAGDIDHDGRVDFNDFAILASDWLKGYDVSIVIVKNLLDNDPNWTTDGQWQFGTPTGMGGSAHGYPDPNQGFTGSNVYGVNLNGDYTVAVGGPYSLTAGPFNCSDLSDVNLSFARWLNTDESTYVTCKVKVSINGTNWYTAWENTSVVTDGDWQVVEYDVSAIAGCETAYVRWDYEILNDRAYPYSGWNIDDVEIRGLRLRE